MEVIFNDVEKQYEQIASQIFNVHERNLNTSKDLILEANEEFEDFFATWRNPNSLSRAFIIENEASFFASIRKLRTLTKKLCGNYNKYLFLNRPKRGNKVILS